MWFEQSADTKDTIDFNAIYSKFSSDIGPEKREEFINEDPATKSN